MSPGKLKLPNAMNEWRLLAGPVIINSSDSRGIFSGGGQASVARRLYLVMDNSTANLGAQKLIHANHALMYFSQNLKLLIRKLSITKIKKIYLSFCHSLCLSVYLSF